MATFTKKLYLKNSAGTQQTANIYSTTGEAGSNYMYTIVDNTQGYIPLVTTSNSLATSGRVLKSGTTYAIASTSTPAYGKTLFTSSGTFTVPTGVTKLKVSCVGGGAGVLTYPGSPDSGEEGSLYNNYSDGYYYSGAGGATKFGSVTANGAGSNGIKLSTSRSDSRDGYSYSASFSGPIIGAGRINGTHYQSFGYKSGTAGYTITAIDGSTYGAYGSGGGGGEDHHNDTVYTITGSSGYVTITTISVTPGQVISCTVGSGGSAVNWWAYYAENGGNGAVLVEYGKGIQ